MNKILISSVASAVLATVSASAFAANVIDDSERTDVTVTDEQAASIQLTSGTKAPRGIGALFGHTITVPSDTINISITGTDSAAIVYGAEAWVDATVSKVLLGNENSNITIDVTSPNGAWGLVHTGRFHQW